MARKGEYQIPFDVHGRQMHYPNLSTGGFRDTVTGEVFLHRVHYNIGDYPNRQDYLNDEVRAKMALPTCRAHPVVWVDNFTFEDRLRYNGYGRGRSSAIIEWKSVNTGLEYTMFLTDFDDLMKRCGIDTVECRAKWTFVKRGQNYGIRLADAEVK